MERSKVKKIYDLVLDNIALNRDSLLQIGFTDDDITLCFTEDILKQKGKNYRLINLEGFCEYGKELSDAGFTEKANKCFVMCSKIDPKFRDNYFQDLLIALKEQDIKNAMRLFETFAQLEPKISTKDLNLFLYLIKSYIVTLPEEQEKQVRKITLSDVYLTDVRYEIAEEENSILESILKAIYVML